MTGGAERFSASGPGYTLFIHRDGAVARKQGYIMGIILWLIAVVLVVAGIIQLIQGAVVLGIVLIVVGLLVGPGGFSLFNRRSAA